MNKNVFKIFLTEDFNQAELDEALPKDLAQAYTNSAIGRDMRSNMSNIDYNAAEYTPISPDEGKEVWKNDPTSLILIIKDAWGKSRAIRFREDGKVDINAGIGDYRIQLPRDKAYIKRDGTVVTDIFKAKINHLLSIADKIYKTNENSVKRDQAKLDSRASNPESPKYTNWDFRDMKSQYDSQIANSRDLLAKVKEFQARHRNETSISRSLVYNPDNGKVSWDGMYGGTGDALFWKDKFLNYFQRWGAADPDTYAAWCCYLLAKNDGDYNSYRNPTEKEFSTWFDLKNYAEKDFNARRRYWNVEKALKEPKERAKAAIADAKSLERDAKRVQDKKDNFTSPTARSSRESDITYWINRYKSRLMDILRELDSYEMKLDELDASDAKQIQEFDKEIADLTQKIADAKKQYQDTMSVGAYKNSPFGRKVPESLEEEKSLDELVDILQSRRNENLEEDFVGDEDKLMALSEFLGIDPEEITDESPEFDTPEGDYLVFTEDEAHDRAVDEIMISFDEMGLEAFTPQFQEQIINEFIDDSVIDDFIEQEIEYYQNEEDDSDMLSYLQGLDTKEAKIDYIKGIYGDLKEFIKPEDIDIQAVAEEAINQDGIAHFISYYDGKENDLGNGYYAYRVN